MLYIISQAYNPVIGKIIDWLHYYDIEFVRIEDFITEFDKINFTDRLSDPENCNSNFFIFNKVNLPKNKNMDPNIHGQLIYEYLFGFFSAVNPDDKIGNILQLDSIPKVKVLKDAQRFGIAIPETLITNCRAELLHFYNSFGSVITKSSHDLFSHKIAGKVYRSYTKELNLIDINNCQTKFGLSLFQEKIEKKCDIKSFYFDGRFYSQAIFSQNNEETEIDFRRYNFNRPSRVSTFQLPGELEQKVKLLLDQYQLKFAIVDFILDSNEKLYFLEINVDGIFEEISDGCNYNCEKLIAQYIYGKQRGIKAS